MDAKKHWKDKIGLKAEKVQIYIPKERYEKWNNEKTSSLSRYIQDLAIKGEKVESDFLPKIEEKNTVIIELKDQIHNLEEELQDVTVKLEKEKGKHGIIVQLEGFTEKGVKSLLSNSPLQLVDIVGNAVSQGWTNDFITKPIEEALYRMAEKGEIEYVMGRGWKLKK
jgi:hypothetical protein